MTAAAADPSVALEFASRKPKQQFAVAAAESALTKLAVAEHLPVISTAELAAVVAEAAAVEPEKPEPEVGSVCPGADRLEHRK